MTKEQTDIIRKCISRLIRGGMSVEDHTIQDLCEVIEMDLLAQRLEAQS